MKKLFSKAWRSSTQARKQRKFLFNAPLNIRHKLSSSSVSKELRKEYGFRSIPVRKDDFVQIMSGQFKGKSGKVTKVALSKLKVYVEGAAIKRSDGTDAPYPISASNLMITKLDLSDDLRVKKIEKRKAN